jgi:hypothetical protein
VCSTSQSLMLLSLNVDFKKVDALDRVVHTEPIQTNCSNQFGSGIIGRGGDEVHPFIFSGLAAETS